MECAGVRRRMMHGTRGVSWRRERWRMPPPPVREKGWRRRRRRKSWRWRGETSRLGSRSRIQNGHRSAFIMCGNVKGRNGGESMKNLGIMIPYVRYSRFCKLDDHSGFPIISLRCIIMSYEGYPKSIFVYYNRTDSTCLKKHIQIYQISSNTSLGLMIPTRKLHHCIDPMGWSMMPVTESSVEFLTSEGVITDKHSSSFYEGPRAQPATYSMHIDICITIKNIRETINVSRRYSFTCKEFNAVLCGGHRTPPLWLSTVVKLPG